MKINSPKEREAFRPQRWWWGLVFAVLLFVAAAPVGRTVAEESISVSCYNLEKSSYPVGNVVVYDTRQAAGHVTQYTIIVKADAWAVLLTRTMRTLSVLTREARCF